MTPHNPDRRRPKPRLDFLKIATIGFAVATVCLALWGLSRTMTPSADVLYDPSVTVNLGDLSSGEWARVNTARGPVLIRHLTAAEVVAMKAAEIKRLVDPSAQNPNLLKTSLATFDNRSFSVNGSVYVILNGSSTRFGAVPVVGGEFGGWFDAITGAHYDVLGRIMRGPTPKNIRVAQAHITLEGILILPNG